MLGWIHGSVENFIRESFGDDTWERVAQEAGVQPAGGFLSSCPYPDSETFKLVLAACRVLGVTPEQALEAYGTYFISYVTKMGYDKLLQTLGSNIAEFLQNLNNLHLYLQLTFPHMHPPAFRCTDVRSTSLQLHYSSSREGPLWALVVGALRGLAADYWGFEVRVTLLRGRHDGTDDHEVLLVEYPHQDVLCDWDGSLAASRHHFTVPSDVFYSLFPFHLLLDSACRVVQAGSVLQRLFPELQPGCNVSEHFKLCHPLIPFDFAAMGEWLNSAFILRARATGLELKGQVVRVPLGPAHLQQHQQQQEQAPSSPASASAAATQHTGPSGPLQSGAQEEPRGSGSLPAAGSCPFASTLGSLQRPARASSPREGHGDGNSRLNSPGADSAAVGGRVCDGGGCSGDGAPPVGLLFMGSVRLEGLEAMRQAGLYVSDIPLHDLNRDFVLAAAQVAAEAQLRERYEALSLELQSANQQLSRATQWLEEEQRRADRLLYQMLPPDVATCLKRGENPPAREHQEATVLFSDVVGFTEIASRCTPLEVCSMLNELYHAFDSAIEEFPELYKVETIGDAYMVVANVTVPCASHADRLLEFAVRMHAEAHAVCCSLGQRIKIRVGMHTGPVVSGVVGKKMPRFCLFGDTVNTASRMESHGLAGHIHISAATYAAIRDKGRFAIRERGVIAIKGKGDMRTYLIVPAEQQETLLLSSPRRASGPSDLTSTGSHHFVAVATPPWSQSGHQYQQYLQQQPQQLLPYGSAQPVSFQRLSSISQNDSPFVRAPVRQEESFTNLVGSALRREESGRLLASQGSGSVPGGFPTQLPSPPVSAESNNFRIIDVTDAPSRQLRKSLSNTAPNRPQSMGSGRFAASALDEGSPSYSALLPARPALLPFPARQPGSGRPEEPDAPASACVFSAAANAAAAALADGQRSAHATGGWPTTSHLGSAGNTGAQAAWLGLPGRSTPAVPRVGGGAPGRNDPRVAGGSPPLVSHPLDTVPIRGSLRHGTDPGVGGEAGPAPWSQSARLVDTLSEDDILGTMAFDLLGAGAFAGCAEALEGEDGEFRGGSEGGAEQEASTLGGSPPTLTAGATGSAVFARRSGGSGGGVWLAHREPSARSRMSRVTRVLREEPAQKGREESAERGGDGE